MNLLRVSPVACAAAALLLASCIDPYPPEPTVWGQPRYGQGRSYPQGRYQDPYYRRTTPSAPPSRTNPDSHWDRPESPTPEPPRQDEPREESSRNRPEPPSRVSEPDPLAHDRPAVPADDLPFGKEVKGRPGLVESPYDKNAPYLDVKGIPSGTKIKCPTTGKIFRVP